MTSPTVTPLATYPQRLNNPSNFNVNAMIFLDSLPTFRTQVNAVSAYINSVILNKDNLGTLTGLRIMPNISENTLTPPTYTGSTVTFTDDVDTLYSEMYKYSNDINNAIPWLDTLLAEVGVVSFDVDKPTISEIAAPMTRQQVAADFNTSANNFTLSYTNNADSLYASILYNFNICCSDMDYGLITSSVTSVVNFHPKNTSEYFGFSEADYLPFDQGVFAQ